jgi:hypothetical protein
MKIVLNLCFVALCFISYSQSGMYIVTEKYDGLSDGTPTFDSVLVTNPSGVTTFSIVPHFVKNLTGHNSAINKIFNNILQQGYRMVEVNNAGGYVYRNTSIWTQSWYFVKP